MEIASEHLNFLHVSHVGRDYGRDWTWAFIHWACELSPVLAFKKVWVLLSNHKRRPSGEGMDPQSICEQARWINFKPDRISAAWHCKWWTLKVYLRQLQSSFILYLSQDRISWHCHKTLKARFPFPTLYLCEVGFSAMTITKTKLQSRLDIRNTLWVSLSPITTRWDHLELQGN